MKKGREQKTPGNLGNQQRLLWEPILQLIGKPWGNGQTSTYLWPSQTEPRRY
jgi:hypothetical protein